MNYMTAGAGPYVDLTDKCAKIDARRTAYRFELDRDIPWDELDASGDYFGPALLRTLGVDPVALARTPAARDLFQWALALASCRAFQLLEECILRFAAKEAARLGPTRSVELLVEEEEKHIRLFERYGAFLAGREPVPGALARFEPHLARSAAAIRRLAEEEAPT